MDRWNLIDGADLTLLWEAKKLKSAIRRGRSRRLMLKMAFVGLIFSLLGLL